MKIWLFLLIPILLMVSCYRIKSSNGGGEVKKIGSRHADPKDIIVPSGLSIEVVAEGG